MFRPLDLSRVGLISFVIRFVWCITGAEPCMEEHFSDSIPIEHSIGDALIEKILVQLEEMKNPLENMLGQSYDKRSNMKGKNPDVQTESRTSTLGHFMCVLCIIHPSSY
ncbi:hypothetical protein AVEN_21464-1 [Araneus ventricosus]|uniref:Uncharacterized protein n=1 Tax=Araneus ventricosus TaxID=182803 RepID=A0A4Y2QLB5_ARAVE|nr:hypothetical protein AVEN_68981-1 [Araneus ventricosus]GBN61358.1 hypothetical protein AVEN_73455-1 [Araneus ventricosus]GBN64056.1 hypothetical protein AVEN_176152-1 [Araneus ventricosus]GBN64080.1 hypothetical protein AVEN_21464-1 [Araneus ventricosus]